METIFRHFDVRIFRNFGVHFFVILMENDSQVTAKQVDVLYTLVNGQLPLHHGHHHHFEEATLAKNVQSNYVYYPTLLPPQVYYTGVDSRIRIRLLMSLAPFPNPTPPSSFGVETACVYAPFPTPNPKPSTQNLSALASKPRIRNPKPDTLIPRP